MVSKGRQTRQHIIEKSLQIFSVKGYFNTSINDILEATGLTKGGLYGHFRSKEDIWFGVYAEAVKIWRSIVLKDVNHIQCPLKRIETIIENDMRNYLGAEVFDGGCFFFNMLVELSGQSARMSDHILKGFAKFSKMIHSWLIEADRQGLLRADLNLKEISEFIVTSLNGATPFYAATRDPKVWQQTIAQLHFFIFQVKK